MRTDAPNMAFMFLRRSHQNLREKKFSCMIMSKMVTFVIAEDIGFYVADAQGG